MIKREEIREGMLELIKQADSDESNADMWEGNLMIAILTYLHSQGVVIKVDRELPECTQYDSEMIMQHDCPLCRRGYVPVEPLWDFEKREVEEHSNVIEE